MVQPIAKILLVLRWLLSDGLGDIIATRLAEATLPHKEGRLLIQLYPLTAPSGSRARLNIMARYLLPDPAGRVGCPFCREGQRHLQHGGVAHNLSVAAHDVGQGAVELLQVDYKILILNFETKFHQKG